MAALVTDHDNLRLRAATLLRDAKVTGGESALMGSVVDASEQPAPAFVKAKTTKAKGKGKGKATEVAMSNSGASSTPPIQTSNGKRKRNPPKVAPDNVAASTAANHTPAASTSNPSASSSLPVLGVSLLPASSIQGLSHVFSSVVPPQAYSVPAYPAPARYYSYNATSLALPARPPHSVVSPPAHYSVPPHQFVPSYHTTLHPHTPMSSQVPPDQLGYYLVGPAGMHQPVYAGVATTSQPHGYS